MVLLILIGIIILVIVILKHHKKLNINNLVVINGGVKSGKTTLSVLLSIRYHRKALIKYYIRKYLLFKKNEEMPLLYSNIPLKYKYYVPLTRETILLEKRVAYGSICLLSEASLIANAQEFRNDYLNEKLMAFCKLWGHISHNGYMFIETQTMSDLHHQFKKNFNNYLYIYTCHKYPFLLRFEVREMLYNYDNDNIQNTFDKDIEKSMLNLWCFKSVWKKFDRWTYSVLTDNLDYDCLLLTRDELIDLDLKTRNIVSYNKYKYLKIGGKENEK